MTFDPSLGITPFLAHGHAARAVSLVARAKELELASHDAKRALQTLAPLFPLLVPRDDGGEAPLHESTSRIDLVSLCLAREAIAYHSPMADSIFAVQGLGSHPVVLGPKSAWREKFLKEVVSGERVGAFALTEPEAGTDVASLKTTARKEGDMWLLDGEKVFISNAGIAHHYVIFANADPTLGKKGISAFIVDAAEKGLHVEKMPMSLDHPLGRLKLSDCRAREIVGEVGMGLRLALGTLDVFRTSVGAAACGMARRALDDTISRVKARIQFGKPLADFQLTQAALAEMATELDASRLLVYRAAWEKDHGHSSATSVAMAKMFATEAAQRIIDRAVQLHGGLGIALGSSVEQLYREIRPLRIYEGTTEIQKLIIGGSLVQGKS